MAKHHRIKSNDAETESKWTIFYRHYKMLFLCISIFDVELDLTIPLARKFLTAPEN